LPVRYNLKTLSIGYGERQVILLIKIDLRSSEIKRVTKGKLTQYEKKERGL
jgi:hypothetical protein